MLNGVIHWSLNHRFIVILAVVLFATVGGFSLKYLAIDAFPDTTPVQVQINTSAPALAPEEIERQISYPVEQAISGLPGLDSVRSISKFGISQVIVNFDDGINIYLARQLIAERLGSVELPEGIEKPKLGPVTTGLGEVFHYLVTSEGKKDLTDLRSLHDWDIRPRMRTVSGTAEINSWGGNLRQYQVLISPERLLKYAVTFDQIVGALKSNNLNVGGGNIDRAGEMYIVQGLGRTSTVEQIRNIVVTAKAGVPIRVGDLAEVVIGHELRRGAVTADGKGEVVIGLGFMLMGENSNEVTWRMKEKLDEIKKTLPADVRVVSLYDRTELVTHVIDTVRKNLFEGGLMVVVILFVFLGNLRASLIVALAIPLSMLFAFSGMLKFGIAGSLLSLGAIDFGMVVDSSVVMIENVVRRLSHDNDPAHSRIDIVRDAAIEVRKPTMFGELIIMMVYLPVLTLEGMEGKLFRPMALTVIFALAGSMVLSLTLMPVLASLLLPRFIADREPWIVRLATVCYAPFLRASLRHPLHVIAMALGALGVTTWIGLTLGTTYIPDLSEGAIVVNVMHLPGTSLDEVTRSNTLMEQLLLQEFPKEIEHIWSRCGTGEVATDPMGVEETDMFIALKPRENWKKAKTQDELVAKMKEAVKNLPGQSTSFSQPIDQRIKEMISGTRANVAVKLFGDDFKILLDNAKEIQTQLQAIEGAADVNIEQLSGQPVLQVRIRQDQIARYGVPARAVLELIEALGGKAVGEVFVGQRRYPLALYLPTKNFAYHESLGDLLVAAPNGERIPLSRLAEIEIVEGPSTIKRDWGKRRIIVQCNVRDRDVGSFVAEAQLQLKKVTLPEHYRLDWSGDFENMQRARTRLMIVVPVALFMVFILLYFTYNSLFDALRVFTGVPFACIGGVLALWLRDLPLSISAGVGFIALSGVSVLNSMVLVTFILHLRDKGLAPQRAIEEAALTRLRPVLMTALVASFGFLPMALSTSMGAEVQRPLATVVIGGVISSTFLTLMVLPAIYLMTGLRVGKRTG